MLTLFIRLSRRAFKNERGKYYINVCCYYYYFVFYQALLPRHDETYQHCHCTDRCVCEHTSDIGRNSSGRFLACRSSWPLKQLLVNYKHSWASMVNSSLCHCDQESMLLHSGQRHKCSVINSRRQLVLMLIIAAVHWLATRQFHPYPGSLWFFPYSIPHSNSLVEMLLDCVAPSLNGTWLLCSI